MSTSAIKLWELYDGLKNQFLFNNDINSIHILLSLYDLEENISNIYPKYICSKNIRHRIKTVLNNNENKDIIAQSITRIIHDDINRIELCFYLEGYKYGFFNNNWVNIIEKRALEVFNIEKIYEQNYLFHFNIKDKKAKGIRNSIRKEIDMKENRDKDIHKMVNDFCEKVIKKKIINLDKYVDKQLKLDFNIYNQNFNIKEECYKLDETHINKVYSAIVQVLTRNLKNIYKDACWYALNDKVLKRYV